MAEIERVLETESSTLLASAVDITGGVTLEDLKTLEEAGCQAALVMTEGDDSVFYSEDEEIPQEVFICAPQPVSVEPSGSTEPQSSPQIQDSRAEEFVPSLSHSIGLMEAGSMHQSGALEKDMESFMEDKVNHVSSSIPDQEVEGDTKTVSESSTACNEELSNSSILQGAMSARDDATPLPVQDQKQIDNSLVAHTVAKTPAEPQSGQATESQEKDTTGADGSLATTQQDEETEELDQGNELSNLTHAKYGTVSYRRIRRGLARQRIEEFEAMMQL